MIPFPKFKIVHLIDLILYMILVKITLVSCRVLMNRCDLFKTFLTWLLFCQHFFNTAVQIQATKAGPYGAATATSDVATVTLEVV